MNKYDILKQYFKFDTFRDKQSEVIDNVIEGNNTLCLMPTGMGKSLIYQVAGLALGKMTIVISPLIALMEQQTQKIEHTAQIKACSLSSFSDAKSQYKYLKKVFVDKVDVPDFLFISPERLLTDGFLEFVLKKNKHQIGLVVIDEAHCISQWGHTFRPAYKFIRSSVRNIFGEKGVPPILCLTATLNPHDKWELVENFNIEDKSVIKSENLLRTNLKLRIINKLENNEAKKEELKIVLDKHKNEKVIVYAHIKKRDYGTRKMAEAFKKMGYNCLPFDADLTDKQKKETLASFESGAVNIIFATSAFGMGIDIPDIRVVVHYLIPESIEQYYQEVGRAGRDGKDAFGYLFFTDTNVKVRRSLIKDSLLSSRKIRETFDEFIKPPVSSRRRKKPDSEQDRTYSFGYTDNTKDGAVLIVFLYLVRLGVIEIVSKGISSLKCFKENTSNITFKKYYSATKNKSLTLIAKKIDVEMEQIINDVFELLYQNELKLEKSPQKVIFYKIAKEFNDDIVNQIHEDLEEKVTARFGNFDKLMNLIESQSDNPTSSIAEYLGIRIQ